MSRAKSTRRHVLLAAALLALFCAAVPPLLAKHASNAGPEDPPIKFKVPIPRPLSSEEELKTFKLPAGFRIEPVAVDPMVQDPIAISFDADGRMWVVEFRGYMHDVDGKGEDQPLGRISILEDTDADGRMDKQTIFLDHLVMPRAVLPTRGGALVVEPPTLAFYKMTKDGTAGEKTIVATDYGVKGGQPEHMANGLYPALDNWIYNASHHSRYRFQQGKWVAAPMASRGQWGISQDDFGRLYTNSNSDLARVDPFPSHYFARNPYYKATAAQNVEMIEPRRQEVWPSHMTPGVNRGYSPGELRDDGTLHHPTATCGLGVYRGDLFSTEFKGNLFIPEPSANVIKRMLVVTDDAGRMSAREAYERMDFLTSTDERFRPVNTCTGPDGALYVVDMYRGVLQHTAFLTNYLIKNIKERQLESPINLGRIWRVVPEGSTPKPVKLPKKGTELVAFLTHPNGWVRDMAQRLLIERGEGATVPLLEKMATAGPTPESRLHALWTLEGMNRLDGPIAVTALSDADAMVRASAIRLCEPLLIPATKEQAMPSLLKLAADPNPIVQVQLALTLSAIADPAADAAMARLLTASAAAPEVMRDAVISGMRGRELELAERLLSDPVWASPSADREKTLASLSQCLLSEHRTARVKHLLELTGAEKQGSWRQVAMLRGMLPPGGASRSRNSGVPLKLIYLDARPEPLASLLASQNHTIRDMAAQVDARLAWPGKPGVPPPPKVIALTPDQQAQFDKGKLVFAQICAACHQPTGLGQDGLAPPLVDSEWVLGNDRRIVRIVFQGLNGPITVNGVSFQLEMPPLTTLSDEDVAAVLTYIRREWEHNAAPVTVETVQHVHDEIKTRSEPWTAKELMQVK